MPKNNHKNFSPAFTLPEILVASALLAMLAVTSFIVYRNQIAKAHDAVRKADLLEIDRAVNDYNNDYSVYPPQSLVNECQGTGLYPYLLSIPCDPINSGEYFYTYETGAQQNWYRLYTKLEQDGETYQLNSDNYSGQTNDSIQIDTVPPTCGTETKYCFSNICGTCCPGDAYRCSDDGASCYFDATCSL